MSLIVQMNQDLDAQRDLASAEVATANLQDTAGQKNQPPHSELPLFAAADQLKKQERVGRYKTIAALIMAIVVLVSIYFAMNEREKNQQPLLKSTLSSSSVKQQSDQQRGQKSKVTSVQAASIERQKPANINNQASQSAELKINLEAVQQESQKTAANSNHWAVNPAANNAKNKLVEKNIETQNKVAVINKPAAVEVVAAQETVANVVLAQNNNSSQQAVNLETKAPVGTDKSLYKTSNLIKQIAAPSIERIDTQTVASARNALQREPVQTVIDGLKKALQQQAGLIESSKLYASLLIASGQYAQAEQALTSYRSQYRNELAFTTLDARLLMVLENYTQALVLIEQQALLGNMSYELLSLQAAAYQSLQKWSLALQSYSELLRYDAKQPRWWLGLAIAHDALGNNGKAKQAYQRVVLAGGLDMALQNYAKSRLAQL